MLNIQCALHNIAIAGYLVKIFGFFNTLMWEICDTVDAERFPLNIATKIQLKLTFVTQFALA